MKKFGGTPVIGIVLGFSCRRSCRMPTRSRAGEAQPIYMNLLGFSIPVVGYQGSVLPALVLGILPQRLKRDSGVHPRCRRSHLHAVPQALSIVGLLIVGPIMHTLELAVFGAVRVP